MPMTNLWQQAARTSRQALDCGALQPIETQSLQVRENGIDFRIRVLSSLRDKSEALRRLARAGEQQRNPFLPPETALFVADVGPSHRCVLNKFCVIERHLLLVTREFEPQLQVLNRADFAALAHCMAAGPALAFYNGGPDGGASQPHKHLQLLPLGDGLILPFDPLLSVATGPAPGTAPRLPFAHRLLAPPPTLRSRPDDAAPWLHETYRAMLDELSIEVAADGQVQQGYNLLLTENWMLLVPRSRERVGDVSVNALGFAGMLLVKRREQAQWLKRQGLMNALVAVTRDGVTRNA